MPRLATLIAITIAIYVSSLLQMQMLSISANNGEKLFRNEQRAEESSGRRVTTTILTTTQSSTAARYPTPVFVWPNVNYSNFADPSSLGYSTWWHEFKHFLLEGIDESPFLERIHDPSYHSDSLIWMTDTNQGKRPSKWCHALTKAVRESQSQKPPNQQQWPLYIFDWSDDPNLPIQYQHCDDLYPLLGHHNVHYVKRSYVIGRHWNTAMQSMELGDINPSWSHNYTYWSGHPVQHVNYGVRTDIVNEIRRVAREEYHLESRDANVASILPRPYDVAHFWPAPSIQHDTTASNENRISRKGVLGDNNSQLRDSVSEALLVLNATYQNISTFTGVTGAAANGGRLEAQTAYVNALLQYKIVVVAQKDHWEDHYRLMEALVSGALVMSDCMIMMPDGLVDGKSIVLYNSVADMIDKIKHYLWSASKEERQTIAREGRRIAMTRHRSWHMMERVVYGKVLSEDKPELASY
jgi:hypothetical protein